jgi:hypothetical protein
MRLRSRFCLRRRSRRRRSRRAESPNRYALGASLRPFPKLRITMRPGYCAGLVASKDDGLIFPRTIVQVPDTRFFVVADMGGWEPKQGRVLLLDPQAPRQAPQGAARGLDLPHGLAVGSDRRIYVGTVETIFRFDPLGPDPAASVETIIRGLPGLRPILADGTVLKHNSHPLKHFVFDAAGRLFVNIGAPSDACATSAQETKPCAAGEGTSPLAAVWLFTPPPGGVFPALQPGEASPKHEVFARGLRNSMALAAHGSGLLLQGENARDIPDAKVPNEEINVLEAGGHYGWPYCHDLTTASREYAVFLKTIRPTAISVPTRRNTGNRIRSCRRTARRSACCITGPEIPRTEDKLIVSLHGLPPDREPGDRLRHRCARPAAGRRAAGALQTSVARQARCSPSTPSRSRPRPMSSSFPAGTG